MTERDLMLVPCWWDGLDQNKQKVCEPYDYPMVVNVNTIVSYSSTQDNDQITQVDTTDECHFFVKLPFAVFDAKLRSFLSK